MHTFYAYTFQYSLRFFESNQLSQTQLPKFIRPKAQNFPRLQNHHDMIFSNCNFNNAVTNLFKPIHILAPPINYTFFFLHCNKFITNIHLMFDENQIIY